MASASGSDSYISDSENVTEETASDDSVDGHVGCRGEEADSCIKQPGKQHCRPGGHAANGQAKRPLATACASGRTATVAASEDDDADAADGEEALRQRREENIKALLSNQLETCRRPVLSKFLTIKEGEAMLRRPFMSPVQGAPAKSDALKRKLAARRHFVPWGSSTPLPIPTMLKQQPTPEPMPLAPTPAPPPADNALPEGIEPLVLWAPLPIEGAGAGAPSLDESIVVDNMLVRFLRPHQREGVQFMFECVAGLRLEEGRGCILADDMGLGKTLQGITLLWTMLTAGHELLGGRPMARRGIIVCPTSLVSNWDSECAKWLMGRLPTMALCESSREDVIASISQFLHHSNPYKVLIISYETFRIHAERFKAPHACDLLICDEAHRLKNDATLTNRALDGLACRRRVLLSGTPMQNHLDEFYAMVDFCNPGVLGTPAQFRKHYEAPILAGREPDATPEQVALGEERSAQLSVLVNNFIMRRTNKLLSAHLPPKVVEVVCCRMTELQRTLYTHYLDSKAARRLLAGRTTGVLGAITSLKKLCNHPKLIYDALHSKVDEDRDEAKGFEGVGALFPPGVFDNGRSGRGGMALGWENTSGKMALLARMLHVLFTETDDRIVVVSNYTQTLDLVAQLCRERTYPFVRLDGSTSINKRQKLVKVFNDPAEKQFVFLLSSKAGGCGLNLIGGNRLVLFDADWNPACDKQAAARVWRDGQKKRVFVYRFLTTGSIEEKVFQRQMSKEGLQQLVSKNGKAATSLMSSEELRELFILSPDTLSDTYEALCRGAAGQQRAAGEAAAAGAGEGGEGGGSGGPAPGCVDVAAAGGAAAAAATGTVQVYRPQVGEPGEEDLANWGYHSHASTVPHDWVMHRVAGDDVTFVFSCEVAGKAVEEQAAGSFKPHSAAHTGCGRGGQSAGAAGGARAPTRLPRPGSASAAAPLAGASRSGAATTSGPLQPRPANATAGTSGCAPGTAPGEAAAAAAGSLTGTLHCAASPALVAQTGAAVGAGRALHATPGAPPKLPLLGAPRPGVGQQRHIPAGPGPGGHSTRGHGVSTSCAAAAAPGMSSAAVSSVRGAVPPTAASVPAAATGASILATAAACCGGGEGQRPLLQEQAAPGCAPLNSSSLRGQWRSPEGDEEAGEGFQGSSPGSKRPRLAVAVAGAATGAVGMRVRADDDDDFV